MNVERRPRVLCELCIEGLEVGVEVADGVGEAVEVIRSRDAYGKPLPIACCTECALAIDKLRLRWDLGPDEPLVVPREPRTRPHELLSALIFTARVLGQHEGELNETETKILRNARQLIRTCLERELPEGGFDA